MSDLKLIADNLIKFLQSKLQLKSIPRLKFVEDKINSKKVLGKTAHYDPSDKSITIYVSDRHPKDILRSIAHETIHFFQDNRGDFNKINMSTIGQNGYEQKDPNLYKIEEEAFSMGNMLFREWDAMKNDEQT